MNTPNDIVQLNGDLEEMVINACRRFPIIFKPILYKTIIVHKAKRVHISTKKAITGYLTIHRVKHTKKRKERLKMSDFKLDPVFIRYNLENLINKAIIDGLIFTKR